MYFDLHTHPAFKSYLTDEQLGEKDDAWTTYRNCIDFAVGNIIDSQASLRQLDRSQTRTAVAAIYVMEDGLDEIFLITRLAPVISHLDKDIVRDIRPVQYWRRFLEKVKHLENSLPARRPGKAFRIASTAGELSKDENNLILAIEGAHILKAEETDDPLLRLDYLKSFRHKVFYLTLCHFARNSFCNQAFAMKLVNPKKVPGFLPFGTGLTDEGKAVIRRAYDTARGRRILIDVKHMSLSGRQQFYAWKKADPSMRDIPIIASHVGVTGMSWERDARRAFYKETEYLRDLDQYVVKYKRPKGLKLEKLKSYFTPTTINLFDEDIKEIIESGGLIGIMMDQRQLGVSKKPFEYFAAADFNALETGNLPTEYRLAPPAADKVLAGEAEEEEVEDLTQRGYRELLTLPNLDVRETFHDFTERARSFFKEDGPEQYYVTERSSYTGLTMSKRKRRHLLHIANNLLHVAKVGGATAWRHVCLGSDFDGLVDAPNNCQNVTEYRDLEVQLYHVITQLIEASGPGFRERYHLGDVRWQLRRFMYDNGRDFVEKHL